jgi:ABC-type glycerol-3-phosphate transport system substrate-binding protein
MKRIIFIAILLSLALFSCSKKSDVVELQNWNFGGRPKLIEFLRQRVYSFEKTHPGIRVTNSDKSRFQCGCGT